MSVITNNTIQPSSGQALTIKDEGGTASITVATNGEATFAENIIVGTAGKGITFGGDPDTRVSSPSVGDRTLYDYEEGNWTATLTPNTGSLTTSTVNHATYTKIGRLVTLTMKFNISDKGSASGGLNISGIPHVPLHETAIAGEIISTGGTYAGYVDTNGTIYTYPGTYVNSYNYTILVTYATS